ncbi:hypothetical protein ABZX85_23065 [Streptomyces sp. NPDC004539]|uniref:hypothetical protein n=1 Tax=Streptomyces sp. NPDC004539 TaxID=3154280 RepID=UPI0033A17969
MSAPLVVNTTDGTVWTRRGSLRDGRALYAPAEVCVCPQYVMVTESELAEIGIAGQADALPMPTAAGARRQFVAMSTALERLRCDLGRAARERHGTNEVLSEACEALAAGRDRIAELEAEAADLRAQRETLVSDARDTERHIMSVTEECQRHAARAAELETGRADERDELAMAPGRSTGTEWGDLVEFAAGAFRRVVDAEVEAAAPEVLAPRTERSCWVAIADALNAAHAAGMPVGIDLDGTLTDHRMWSVVWDRAAERWTVAGYDDEPDGIDRLAAPTQAPQTEDIPALTVYRASHDSVVMGLYTTAAEARKHCETEERRSWLTGTTLSFDWIEDEEDGIAELVVVAGQNEESTTGYVVTALEIAASYDEEADE